MKIFKEYLMAERLNYLLAIDSKLILIILTTRKNHEKNYHTRQPVNISIPNGWISVKI